MLAALDQVEASVECLALLPDRAAAIDCFSRILDQHSQRWDAVAEKVNDIAADVFAP